MFNKPSSFACHPFLAFLLVGLSCLAGAQAQPSGRQYAPGSWSRFDELPAGRLRSQLEQLPPAAQAQAGRWLRSFHFTAGDLPALHADRDGGIFYVCKLDSEVAATAAPPVTSEISVPVSPLPANLVFHSRPGSANILYLNFTGETVTDTAWNTNLSRLVIPAVAFSTDGDLSTFSEAEQLAIKRIWQRVAEDYAAFDIDVTTARPATFNNRTINALITRNTDANGQPNPFSTAGGVAYVNAFNLADFAIYRPAWIYQNNLANDESYIAEATSHEAGHNLGLSHDSCSACANGYYGGHGSGDTSWGPIMGTGYDRNVSQWSKGEYYLADNTQDDLATLAGKIAYRADTVGSTAATAAALVMSNGTNVVSTTPENDPANTNSANKGVLERNTDVDVFSFVTGSGAVNLSVKPWIMPSGRTRGGNLDVRLELYNEAGTLLLANDPASLTTAAIVTNLIQGRYYLHLKNTGTGSPTNASPSGYTSYGSIGQYFISGFVTASSGFVAPPLASATVPDITSSGQGSYLFTVSYTDDVAVNVSSIDSADVRVTGPGGYDQLAQFVSLNLAGNGSPRTATYAAPPLNGSAWLPADNGLYTLTMQSNQVADVEGAFVPPGQLDQFTVTVPVSVYSANMTTNPGWTLQPDWEYGPPAYAVNAGGPASGFTGANIIGYNLNGNYGNDLSSKYATTPVINTAGTTSLTLRFRRWLGLWRNDSATIEASTNGSAWLTVWSTTEPLNDSAWTEVQYALPASVVGSPALRLRWGLSSGKSQNDIGWNLDDVEILAGGAIDTTPPTAALSVATLTTAGSPSHSCSVTYTDATAVKLSSLNSSNLLVTGPNGFSNLVEFVGADLPLDGSPITGSYSITAPGGIWDVTDNGSYTLTLLAGQVTDTLNNSVAQSALGNFSVAIPTNTPGVLGVTPGNGLSSTGYVGGPFLPNTLVYALTNSGGSPLNWSASADAAWLDLSATNGTLAVGAGATLSVSLNAAATALIASNFTATVSFVNTSSGNGNSQRGVDLTVIPVPTVALNLSALPAAWGSVSPTNGSYPLGTNLQLTATAAPYYQFTGWTGDLSSASNPLGVVLNSNLTAQAGFAEILTTNFPTPQWWLAANGYTNDFENAVIAVGANGYPLWQSYVAGLAPNDPGSQLLLAVSPLGDGTNLVFAWNTVTGRVYSVWSSANLPLGFTPLHGLTNLPWTVTTATNAIDAAGAGQFFRLEVQKP